NSSRLPSLADMEIPCPGSAGASMEYSAAVILVKASVASAVSMGFIFVGFGLTETSLTTGGVQSRIN
ncbi:MAG: hypothetical protein HY746_00285, partial [Elusimicrobia bacterium]|nr:hypothetical protein [Elusimicrobiota bacterium]